MRFLIVDDHPLVRRGTRELLVEAFADAVVVEAASGNEMIAHLAGAPVDLVILDISLPGHSGLTLLKTLQDQDPMLRVLVVSHHAEEQYAIRALRSGARGYLTKSSAPEELVNAAKKVLSGGKYVTASLAELLAAQLGDDPARPLHHTLSDRELEVLRKLAAGKSVKEIGAELDLSVKTVSTYRTRLLEKLQLKSNSELVRYALGSSLME